MHYASKDKVTQYRDIKVVINNQVRTERSMCEYVHMAVIRV